MPMILHKTFLQSILVCAVSLIILTVFGFLAKDQLVPSVSAAEPYITSQGTNFLLNGQPFKFTGINAFNIGTFAGSNAGCGSQTKDLDALFSQLRPNSVVRMWASQGGMATNVTTKQTDWAGLDRAVNAAEKNGMKLILVLGDQAGACDDGHWRDVAWYQEGYKTGVYDSGNGLTPLPYLEYVKLIVSRYKDSPVIALWEPLNEPQAADCQGAQGISCYAIQTCNEPAAREAMRGFFDTVGGVIKSIDRNHLVASGVGGMGQCGAIYEDFKYLHESQGIDVATYHDYDRSEEPMPGDPWNGLQKRLDQMKLVNKPLIIEEIGMLAADNQSDCMNLSKRRDNFKAKMDAQFAAGISGYMPWALTGSLSKYCNYDIGGSDPTLALLHDYPLPMGEYTDTLSPTAPTNLTVTTTSPTQVILQWTASTDSVGVSRYDIFRNEIYFTSTTNTDITVTYQSPQDTYFVKGKDAANNNSGKSNTVTVSPSPTPSPTSAPPYNSNYNNGWQNDYNSDWQAPW